MWMQGQLRWESEAHTRRKCQVRITAWEVQVECWSRGASRWPRSLPAMLAALDPCDFPRHWEHSAVGKGATW